MYHNYTEREQAKLQINKAKVQYHNITFPETCYPLSVMEAVQVDKEEHNDHPSRQQMQQVRQFLQHMRELEYVRYYRKSNRPGKDMLDYKDIQEKRQELHRSAKELGKGKCYWQRQQLAKLHRYHRQHDNPTQSAMKKLDEVRRKLLAEQELQGRLFVVTMMVKGRKGCVRFVCSPTKDAVPDKYRLEVAICSHLGKDNGRTFLKMDDNGLVELYHKGKEVPFATGSTQLRTVHELAERVSRNNEPFLPGDSAATTLQFIADVHRILADEAARCVGR